MTNVATLAVAMVGSVITVSWLTWRLVRGVPDGYDSETEVKTPLVTIRRRVQRSECCIHRSNTVQRSYGKVNRKIYQDAFNDTNRPGGDDKITQEAQTHRREQAHKRKGGTKT
jgi:hypothetical protein